MINIEETIVGSYNEIKSHLGAIFSNNELEDVLKLNIKLPQRAP